MTPERQNVTLAWTAVLMALILGFALGGMFEHDRILAAGGAHVEKAPESPRLVLGPP